MWTCAFQRGGAEELASFAILQSRLAGQGSHYMKNQTALVSVGLIICAMAIGPSAHAGPSNRHARTQSNYPINLDGFGAPLPAVANSTPDLAIFATRWNSFRRCNCHADAHGAAMGCARTIGVPARWPRPRFADRHIDACWPGKSRGRRGSCAHGVAAKGRGEFFEHSLTIARGCACSL